MGVSGKGSPMQGPTTKQTIPAKGSSAGIKPGDGTTSGSVPGTSLPTKKVANPNGNTAMGANGQNAHSNIAKGPGKPGASKR